MKTFITIILTTLITMSITYGVSVKASPGVCIDDFTLNSALDNIADWSNDTKGRSVAVRDTALSPVEVVNLLNQNEFDAERIHGQVVIIREAMLQPPSPSGPRE